LGYKQLKKFIDVLEEQGPELDEYTILYYTEQLLNGPLIEKVIELTENLTKLYWFPSPNILGITGNTGLDFTSTPVFPTGLYNLNANTDTYNKLPLFMQDILTKTTRTIQDIFVSNFDSALTDNTLPLVDKQPTDRQFQETTDGRNAKPHGNYIVKDVEFQKIIENVQSQIFDKVKKFLKDETYRLYEFKKTYNAYDAEKNTDKTGKIIINRKLTYIEGNENKEIEIKTDLMGNTYDGEERRKAKFKILGQDKDKEFELYTIKGQLGSGEKVKKEPIEKKNN